MQLEFSELLSKPDKDRYDGHLKDYLNPHKVTCNQIGALPSSGNQRFSGKLTIVNTTWEHLDLKDTAGTNKLGIGRFRFASDSGRVALHISLSENDTNTERNYLLFARTPGQTTWSGGTFTLNIVNGGTTTTYQILTSNGGTLTGNLISNNPAPATSATRNIRAGTASNAPANLKDGEIYLYYQ